MTQKAPTYKRAKKVLDRIKRLEEMGLLEKRKPLHFYPRKPRPVRPIIGDDKEKLKINPFKGKKLPI